MEFLTSLTAHITGADILVVFFLIFLEGILSIDNALVLAILARPLPIEQQRKALTYGLIGAVFFRLVALGFVTQLLKWNWVKFVGGAYLLFLAIKHFFFKESEEDAAKPHTSRTFWKTVIAIELTDVAFALDSILAAVALSNKFWVVFTGGIIGVIMMRFAATMFISLLKKYPGFENAAYLLVLLIGVKITLEGFRFEFLDFHSAHSPATWIFWTLMLVCFLTGFKKSSQTVDEKNII